ncbi:probable G-protein coupled receptor 150 [Anolis carolinensis]|uniref:probable G-protein coupled receptor 150 n=1 Tax=Anolis carolinensis TaxID=28377 RepID=UPI002F2B3853
MTEAEGLTWLAPNASVAREQKENLSAANASVAPLWATVAHPARVPTAAAILLLALLSNGLLLHRLCCCYCCGERRRKKADFLLAHLAVADLCCAGLLLGPQLSPSELATDNAACRLLRVLQGWGLLATNNMLVLIAFERGGLVAPGGPSARRFSRAALASLGWLLALLLALPQAAAFPRVPRWPRWAYAAYWGLAGFVVPSGLLGAACGRILSSLRASPEEKEEEKGEEEASSPRSLPRARTRALHLALALGALFALCGLPRFALELAAAAPEGPPADIGSLLAAANAAFNPFACLLFHSHKPWARRLQRSLCPEGPPPRRKARRQAPPPRTLPAPPRRPSCPCQPHAHALAEPFQA